MHSYFGCTQISRVLSVSLTTFLCAVSLERGVYCPQIGPEPNISAGQRVRVFDALKAAYPSPTLDIKELYISE